MRRSRVDSVTVDETVQVGSHYILGTSSHADDLTWVLKEADTFAVLDRSGDIRTTGLGEQGLFHEGTRFLSRLEIECYGLRPMLLSSSVREGNALLVVDMTNADVYREHHLDVPRQSIHLFRSKFLRTGACHERLQLRNHTTERRAAVVRIRFAADFHDIFEVRGFERARRGDTEEPRIESASVTLAYTGLDGVTRRTRLRFSPRPTELCWRARGSAEYWSSADRKMLWCRRHRQTNSVRVCSPASRRFASLRPRFAGLPALTPAPRTLVQTGSC